MIPGTTPDVFAKMAIEEHIKRDCKGKLRKIERSYVDREMARRAAKTDSPQQEME
jgi:hypothetical protein